METEPLAAEAVLKARCRTDRRLFARFFFHEKLEFGFHRAHLEWLSWPKVPYRERPPMSGWRRARMLPRGNGKTTICIRIEVCHDIVYQFEEFIVVLAMGTHLAWQRVREVALELKFNKRLRHYFGALDDTDGVWRENQGEIETSNGVTVLGKSRKSQVRGIVHPLTNARPTKIIADDFEDSEEVLNPELREKDKRYFREDVEGATDIAGRTVIQATGTPLHRDAWLPSLAREPAWDFRAYPAISSWPTRMDLWERCRDLWAAAGVHDPDDPEDPTRKTASEIAQQFYRSHRKAMDEGAEVLWSEGEPLLELMLKRWAMGESAFSKEKLLEPRDASLATFDVDRIIRHRIEGDHLLVLRREGEPRKVPLSSLRFVAFHDPAKGKRRKGSLGDFAAIVVMGVEQLPSGGRFGHVVSVWMDRKPISDQIAAAFEMAERWRFELVVENDTLGLVGEDYRRVRNLRRASHRFWQLPIKTLDRQTVSKAARIGSLEPAYSNGWITWNVDLPMEYVNQHLDHPTGDHDDGPDATEGAWRAATRKGAHLALVSLD